MGNLKSSQEKNSEMLRTAGARLEEQLRHIKLEGQRLHAQMLENKRLLVDAGNHQESRIRQIEMMNRELEEAKNQAESKTRECVALVVERECLALKLKNADEDIRNSEVG